MQNQYITEFLRHLSVIQGKSLRTKTEYQYEISLFLKYLKWTKENDHFRELKEMVIDDIDLPFLENINLEDIYGFMEYCQTERGNGASALARKVAALKTFFNYLTLKKKYFKENPTDELDTPKIGKRNPVYLTEGEVKKLYTGIRKTHYYRDYCLITIFLNCGVRLSELQSIDMKSIKGDSISLIGKGNKERVIYLNESCLKAIEEYVNEERAMVRNSGNEDALFLSQKGTRLSGGAIQKVIKELNKNSGLEKEHLSPHKLRHTMATLLYQNGADLISLQQLLGHESVATTQIYTQVTSKTLRDVIESNPLNNKRTGG